MATFLGLSTPTLNVYWTQVVCFDQRNDAIAFCVPYPMCCTISREKKGYSDDCFHQCSGANRLIGEGRLTVLFRTTQGLIPSQTATKQSVQGPSHGGHKACSVGHRHRQ